MRYIPGRSWILLFTAFFFISGCILRGGITGEKLSHEILRRISHAVWLEEREYFDISEEELLEIVEQDRNFDGWLAQKARKSGITLTPEEEEVIRSHRNMLQIFLAAQDLTNQIEIPAEELQSFAEREGWLSPIPDKFEVFYIFIDARDASTPEEKEYCAQKAQEIREKITKENFQHLARLWSDVPSSERGGSLGLISLEDRGPTFAQHVRQTEPGTISLPLPTPSGWNILYVRSHIPEEKREFTEEELLNMVRRFHAEPVRQQLRHDAGLLNEIWEEADSVLKSSYREELSWYEDFLLAKHYIRSLMEQKEPCREELQVIYQENRESFRRPPSYKAREILSGSHTWSMENTPAAWLERREVRNTARRIREEIMEGKAGFDEYARKYSEASSAEKGGDIGWITPPSSALYDRTLSGLQPGEISAPLITKRGYLLLYLEEIQPAPILSFEDALPMLRSAWYHKELRNLMEILREEWQSGAENHKTTHHE